MPKYISMSNFDPIFDNLEEYVNKQGCTLGADAERLQKLLYSITYCYLHGVVTDSQVQKMNEKFEQQFCKALREKE